jgi:hypothetical protein
MPRPIGKSGQITSPEGAAPLPPVPVVLSIAPNTGSTAGGTPVTITGNNFLTATSAAVGGLNITAFHVVDDHHITGNVQAHGAGAANVTVTSPSGTSAPLVGGFTYVVPFTPTGLNLSGYWRGDDYSIGGGIGTWIGTASAGTSGGKNLTSTVSPGPPAVGAALNGHPTVDFPGFPTSNFVSSDAHITGDFLTLSTYSGWALVFVRSIITDFGGGSAWANCAIAGSASEDWVLGVRSTGPAVVPTNFPGAVQTTLPGLSQWALVRFRYSANVLEIGVNSGAMVPNACNDISEVATQLKVGLAAQALDGIIAEIATSKIALTDADFANVKAYVNARYGLAL